MVNSDITNHEKALRIAKAYLIEAHSDFEAVDTLIEHGKPMASSITGNAAQFLFFIRSRLSDNSKSGKKERQIEP